MTQETGAYIYVTGFTILQIKDKLCEFEEKYDCLETKDLTIHLLILSCSKVSNHTQI